MYYNFLVKIPENTGKISKNKRGNTTYIEFTYGRKYNPDKNITFLKEQRLERCHLRMIP